MLGEPSLILTCMFKSPDDAHWRTRSSTNQFNVGVFSGVRPNFGIPSYENDISMTLLEASALADANKLRYVERPPQFFQFHVAERLSKIGIRLVKMAAVFSTVLSHYREGDWPFY